MKRNDLQERMIEFAVEVIAFTGKLPNNPAGRHIAGQLMRSGTSPAPNYAEARGAESRKDFIHKLKIVLKELNESVVWQEIVKRSRMLSDHYVKKISDECVQLSRMIAQSIITANQKQANTNG